jgi:hypothetical protein
MNPTGLIPEAGMGAITPEEWAFAIQQLSEWIAQLRSTTEGLEGPEVVERELVLELMCETLVDLLCLPKAQPWLQECRVYFDVTYGGAC